ncbi:TonB-dependent receptor [Caulobacter rhizosphaerae]|uniref:TonB-dependent receptor n=1 Tax=Caulobacter rhizosphaerae TaxID=2010972 RepID=UPI0013D2D6E9|nr:TonB-dependent receptor [Caulobacter rhizosphaerae]GGL35504.1 TonB-dependent receptor [Caulobacter rhizosphaerae]
MSHRHWILGLVAASSTFAITAAASAQTASAPASQPASVDTIEELVVTAQKREQRLIEVPLSVAAVGSDQLQRQNITSISDLSRAVPSISANGSVRGVSTNGAARSSEGAVAVVLDGVELGHPAVGASQVSSIFDVERVEVLSGPQGMLFGKNASAGVINIVTKAPNPSRFEAIGHADVGNAGFVRLQGVVNVPVSDNAALRISAHRDENEGIVRNTLTGGKPESHSTGVRGRFLWEPSSDLAINLIADYDRAGSNGLRDVAYAIAPTAALQARLAACGIVASLSNRQNCAEGNSKVPGRDTKYGFSGQVDYQVGGFTLTSITAYRHRQTGDFDYNGLGGDSDFLSTDILSTNLTPERLSTISQELRLTSPAGEKLEYVAGLFYSQTDQRDQVIQAGGLGALPPPLRIGRIAKLDIYSRSMAAFGQATYHVTDAFSLIAGARYTDDTLKDVSQSLTNTTTPSVADYGYIYSPAFFLAPVNAKVKTDNFSWKLGAQYVWSRELNAYFTATRGYKGPAVNDQASPPLVTPVIKPEIPMYYEAGLKGAFLDGRVLGTVALFHNKVKDFQTSVYSPATATNPVAGFGQGNAPNIVSKGVEVNLTGRATRELTFSAGAIYNDASYSDSFLVACAPSQVAGVGACSAAGTTKPVSQIAGVPKWRVLLNGEYAKEISSGLTGFVQSDLTYESKQFTQATPDPMIGQPEHWLLGGRVGVRSTDGHWGLSLFGRNLLDKHYDQLSYDVLSGFNGGAGRSFWITPAMGRTWGATLDARF